jgi:hypothetical protein
VDDRPEFTLAGFIRADSDLIPSSLVNRTSPLHSFNGWTERPNEGPAGVRLDNINVTISEGPKIGGDPEAARWQAGIAVSHRLTFDSLITDPAEFFDTGAEGVFTACVDRMHELNKNLVRRVLADATIARIPGLAV